MFFLSNAMLKTLMFNLNSCGHSSSSYRRVVVIIPHILRSALIRMVYLYFVLFVLYEFDWIHDEDSTSSTGVVLSGREVSCAPARYSVPSQEHNCVF